MKGAAAGALILAYAAALLSIGITRDWRLTHEDNGSTFSTMALSHVRLGLARTKGHDLLYNPRVGEGSTYGHHPPGLALSVAAGFVLLGSDAPWAARAVPIAFHLGSIALLMAWLRLWLSSASALFGGFAMATMAMGSFFGRMVGYEPLGLFAAMTQLYAYGLYHERGRSRRALALLGAGVVLGGLIDWAPLYFSLVLFALEARDLARGGREAAPALCVLGACGLGVFLFDLWHLDYACGSLKALGEVTSREHLLPLEKLSLKRVLLRNLEMGRRYFSHAGLASALLVGWALLRREASPLWPILAQVPAGLRRGALACLAAGGGYLLCIVQYSMNHHYSQFYLLPFAVLSLVLAWERLRALAAPAGSWLRFAPAVLMLDLLATSGYTLHFRHTRPLAFASEVTRVQRETFLVPRDLPAPP